MNIQLLTAIAEQNRMRIIELLADQPLSVGAISKRLGLRQPQVSKHLKVLYGAGFVVAEHAGQQRVYYLQDEPLVLLLNWSLSCRKKLSYEKVHPLDYLGELKIQH